MRPFYVTRPFQSIGRRADCNPLQALVGIRQLGRCARFWARAILLAALSSMSCAAVAQKPEPPAWLAMPASAWAAECANNEVDVIQHKGSYLRYRLHTVDEKNDVVRDQIETPEGTVSRLVQRNGRPLTQEEEAAERDRLLSLAASPGAFARHARRDQENKKMGVELVKMMPSAMLWSYAPGQPQLSNQHDAAPALVVLDFKPNPGWSPPNLESDLLTGLEGRVWIDPGSGHMVHMEARLFHAVNIGWGMLAHIYPGGTATVEQVNAGSQRWLVKHIVEQLTAQALVVRMVKQRLVSDATDVQPVPPMGYQQAVKMLLDKSSPSR